MRIILVIGLLCAVSVEAAQAATMRALVITASRYDERAVGWLPLSAHNDVPLLRAGLLRRGFADKNITVLSEQGVTRQAVLDALTALPAEEGDHLYIHYSGHGQRLTDQRDGDEADGYDETLALYDTPSRPDKAERGYKGERHLRDDDLGRELARLRAAVGPKGSLAVVLDSCHSGTATRATASRGYKDFNLDERAVKRERKGSGYDDVLAQGEHLAPMVLLSAAQANQPAREIKAADGKIYGALSYAIARVLADEPGLDTWSAVYEAVFDELRQTAPAQVPQIEGARNTRMFDGSHVDVPFYTTIREVRDGGRVVLVNGGTLLGLGVGSKLEVHRRGALTADQYPPLGTGTVTASEAGVATLTLASPAQDLKGARVFARELKADGLALRVAVQLGDPALEQAWATALKKLALVEVVRDNPEWTLFGHAGTVYLVDGSPRAGERPQDPWASAPIGSLPPDAWQTQLSNKARSKLISEVELTHPEWIPHIEILPAKWKGAGREPDDCVPSAPSQEAALIFNEGDALVIRIRVEGAPAHMSVLLTGDDGTSRQLYPSRYAASEGRRSEIDLECWEMGREEGSRPGVAATETLKVFAADDPQSIDFRNKLGATRGVGSQALELLKAQAGQAGALSRGSVSTKISTATATYVVAAPESERP